ncbi:MULTISPECIES: efflux RND transporter periplasmic adaptor subunit [Chitinophagaceae]
MNIIKFSLQTSMLAGIALLFGCKEKATNNQGNLADVPIEVKVISAQDSSTQPTNAISYSSTVGASKTIQLSFQVGGTVLRIPVEVGQYVIKGQLIAEVDETVYRSQYNAQLAQAQLAKESYERILTVFNKGSIAEIKMLEAKSQYEQATAAAKATYQNIPHCKLYAPQSGYIGAKKMEAGTTAGPGIPVVELLNINPVNIHVPIPEAEINHYKKGDKAQAIVPALDNKSFGGSIDKVSIASSMGSPLYTVDVKVDNPNMVLKPGMSCNVFFDKKSSANNTTHTIIVPAESIQVDETGNNFVFIVNGNKAAQKKITLGETYSNGIAIKDGIAPTDKIIVSGFQKIANGSPIKIIQ